MSLEELGLRVMRFWNNEVLVHTEAVLVHTEAVLEAIHSALDNAPSPGLRPEQKASPVGLTRIHT
jgi:hypothetical protein